jgi:GTPase
VETGRPLFYLHRRFRRPTGAVSLQTELFLLFACAALMFVDRVQIEVKAGRGGEGCVSFRREKFVPRGGPDGGDGGDGGSVIILATAGVDSLASLSQRKHWRAESGERGGSSNCHGRNAEDLVIQVPPGTVVIDAGSRQVLMDLAGEGEQVVAARCGRGGKGNLRFKSSTNRAPRQGSPAGDGESRLLILELKVIADVGLIGKPNAGKSTLLSRLSRARPEIADYPFTTKYPNLGMVQIDRERSFVMADIPGLIEGAHSGAGLGHEFLRHVERAGILVHLVEPAPVDGSDPITNYEIVRSELDQYVPSLHGRPEIVAITKAELPAAADVRDRLAARLKCDVLAVSAVTGAGLDRLLRAITAALDERIGPAAPAQELRGGISGNDGES